MLRLVPLPVLLAACAASHAEPRLLARSQTPAPHAAPQTLAESPPAKPPLSPRRRRARLSPPFHELASERRIDTARADTPGDEAFLAERR